MTEAQLQRRGFVPTCSSEVVVGGVSESWVRWCRDCHLQL